MAQYPSQAATFSTKVTNQVIAASHVNDLQDEVAAVTDGLVNGLAHHVRPDTTATRDLGTSTRKFRDLYLSRNASIAGDLAVAGTLTGDGSGLTGVPISGVLDDLSDVDATTPTNGQLLTFNSSSGKWEAQTLSIGGGGVVNLDDLLDVVLTAPTEGDILQYISGQWINQPVAAVPTGTIVHTMRDTAPTGWIFLDGGTYLRATYATFYAAFSGILGAGNGTTTFTTPDLSRRVLIGKAASGTASTIGETGGTFSHLHTVASHVHGVGTIQAAGHTHAAGTLSSDLHTHGVGTLVSSSHTHGAGSFVMPNHGHSLSASTNTTGAHTHTTAAHTHGFSGETDGPSDTSSEGPGSGGQFLPSASHTHGFSGNTDSGGGGSTSSDGDHSHSVSGTADGSGTAAITGTSGATTPTLSGSTAVAAPAVVGNTGSTTPSMSGSTAGATALTDSANQAYITFNVMVKT